MVKLIHTSGHIHSMGWSTYTCGQFMHARHS